MKKMFYWLALIVGILALVGSCAKKDDTTTTTTTTTSGISTTTTASGSITVGSVTMSGTYISACISSGVSTLVAAKYTPSDVQSYAGIFVVTGNDNVSDETLTFTDTSCSSSSSISKTQYDNFTVGSASGSNYPVTLTKVRTLWTANTTAAETWIEAIWTAVGLTFDVTVGTEKLDTYAGSSNPRYGLMNLSSTTLYWADVDKTTTPSSVGTMAFTKQ